MNHINQHLSNNKWITSEVRLDLRHFQKYFQAERLSYLSRIFLSVTKLNPAKSCLPKKRKGVNALTSKPCENDGDVDGEIFTHIGMRNGLMEAHTSFSLFSRFSFSCGAFGVNFRIFWGFKEEYYTQRNRCQLTRCRVDQHSSRVRSLIAGVLFERESCWKNIFRIFSRTCLEFSSLWSFLSLKSLYQDFVQRISQEDLHRNWKTTKHLIASNLRLSAKQIQDKSKLEKYFFIYILGIQNHYRVYSF